LVTVSVSAARKAAKGWSCTTRVLGVIVSRHLLKLDELAEAPPEQVIELLRPCLRLLTRADDGTTG